MSPINFLNLALYILIGILLYLGRTKIPATILVILGSLVLHGLVFNGVFIYRDAVWASCPPVCGLQEWSSAVRLHLQIAIGMTVFARLIEK